jgi:hypothetical protein
MAYENNKSGIYYQNSTCRIELTTQPTKTKGSATYFSKTQEVISCALSKAAGEASGHFSLELLPHTHDWLKIIRPDDWVNIYLDNGRDGGEVLAMTGLVDTIQRSRQVQPGTGATSTTISVAGRDLGKVLLETDPVADPKLTRDLDGLSFMDGVQSNFTDRINETAAGAVERVFATYFGPTETTAALAHSFAGQFQLPDGGRFYNQDGSGAFVLDLDSSIKSSDGKLKDELKVTISALPNLSQSMWSLIQHLANLDFNRLFVEMIVPAGGTKPKPTLWLRPHPFSAADFDALPSIKFDINETFQDSLGLSSHEIKNWIRVDSSVSNSPVTTNVAAVTHLGYYNKDSIQKHGLKRLDRDTMFNAEGDIIPGLQQCTDQFLEWYWNAEELYSGSIVSRLRPDLRLTQRLDYADGADQYSFIIESYQHQWSYPNKASTTVHVSRGRLQPARIEAKDEIIAGGIGLISSLYGGGPQ